VRNQSASFGTPSGDAAATAKGGPGGAATVSDRGRSGKTPKVAASLASSFRRRRAGETGAVQVLIA
jgi:hypothetical protein